MFSLHFSPSNVNKDLDHGMQTRWSFPALYTTQLHFLPTKKQDMGLV